MTSVRQTFSKLEDVEKPTPADDEVLVAVRAASVNMFDWYMVQGKPALLRLALGLTTPKPLGVDLSGIVEAVGQSVTEFKPGDRVFGTGRDKGLRSKRGAFAEYVSTPARALAIMPRNSTFEQAAGVPMAGLTALQGLRDHGRIQRGQKVLINGASGGIGTFAVQIAKAFGADVTGVCSTRNADMVRSIGADHVIDYTRENFTTGATRYDVILDIVGSQPWPACRRVLTDSGKYVLAGGPPGRGLRLMLLSPFTSGQARLVCREVESRGPEGAARIDRERRGDTRHRSQLQPGGNLGRGRIRSRGPYARKGRHRDKR